MSNVRRLVSGLWLVLLCLVGFGIPSRYAASQDQSRLAASWRALSISGAKIQEELLNLYVALDAAKSLPTQQVTFSAPATAVEVVDAFTKFLIDKGYILTTADPKAMEFLCKLNAKPPVGAADKWLVCNSKNVPILQPERSVDLRLPLLNIQRHSIIKPMHKPQNVSVEQLVDEKVVHCPEDWTKEKCVDSIVLDARNGWKVRRNADGTAMAIDTKASGTIFAPGLTLSAGFEVTKEQYQVVKSFETQLEKRGSPFGSLNLDQGDFHSVAAEQSTRDSAESDIKYPSIRIPLPEGLEDKQASILALIDGRVDRSGQTFMFNDTLRLQEIGDHFKLLDERQKAGYKRDEKFFQDFLDHLQDTSLAEKCHEVQRKREKGTFLSTYCTALQTAQAAHIFDDRLLHDHGVLRALSHGTHVAGIAVGSNPPGLLNKYSVTVESYPIGHDQLPSIPAALAAIRLPNVAGNAASSRREKVYNLSVSSEDGAKNFTEAFCSNPQALFVVAAGEAEAGNTCTRYPSCLGDMPNVLSVSAVTSIGEPLPGGRHGAAEQCCSLAAYGEKVLAPAIGGRLGFLSGSSQAAPYVSAVAALFYSLSGTEVLNEHPMRGTWAVKNRLMYTSDRLHSETWQSGIINAKRALSFPFSYQVKVDSRVKVEVKDGTKTSCMSAEEFARAHGSGDIITAKRVAVYQQYGMQNESEVTMSFRTLSDGLIARPALDSNADKAIPANAEAYLQFGEIKRFVRSPDKAGEFALVVSRKREKLSTHCKTPVHADAERLLRARVTRRDGIASDSEPLLSCGSRRKSDWTVEVTTTGEKPVVALFPYSALDDLVAPIMR